MVRNPKSKIRVRVKKRKGFLGSIILGALDLFSMDHLGQGLERFTEIVIIRHKKAIPATLFGITNHIL
jgi:hypothetical protein